MGEGEITHTHTYTHIHVHMYRGVMGVSRYIALLVQQNLMGRVRDGRHKPSSAGKLPGDFDPVVLASFKFFL